MPTSALPRGKLTDVLIKAQSVDFKTPATGNYSRVHIYSHSLEEKRPFEDDPLLGKARQNDRDAFAPINGLPTLDGQVVVPLDLAEIGVWLKKVFGAPTTSGTTNYTHVFTSGVESLPFDTLEAKLASGLYLQYVGLLASKMSLQLDRSVGIQQLTLAMLGRNENKLGATGGGTPTTFTQDPLAKTIGVFKINGTVAAHVLSTSLDYDNKPAPQDYVGDNYVAGYVLDADATFAGSMRLRFVDATYYDLAVSGATLSAEWLWQAAVARSLSILTPKIRLVKRGIPIGGPGAIEQSFDFQAEQDASNPMVTATLKNQVASY